MSSTIRPGSLLPTPAYRSGVPGPRPGYKPAVRHEHGNRRQEQYRSQTEREAIAESMASRAETHASSAYQVLRDQEQRMRRLRALLDLDEPAKTHVTKQRRVIIHELAKQVGLTSAQTLLLVNKQFGEYAKYSSSSIATIVATEILSWVETEEGVATLDLIRNGQF